MARILESSSTTLTCGSTRILKTVVAYIGVAAGAQVDCVRLSIKVSWAIETPFSSMSGSLSIASISAIMNRCAHRLDEKEFDLNELLEQQAMNFVCSAILNRLAKSIQLKALDGLDQ